MSSSETDLLDDDRFEVRVLDDVPFKLFRTHEADATVRMTIEGDRSWRDVRVARALPFSDPDHYIGFRDGSDKDIGIVQDPALLDAETQKIISEEVERRYFTPKVKKVTSVEELHGTVTWEVETDRGQRRFIVRNLRDSSYPLGSGRLMMLDTEGNRYEFPDINSYGAKAFAVLTKVI